MGIFDWIKENHTRKYFEWWEAKNKQGLPLKRDHKNRSLNFAYSQFAKTNNLQTIQQKTLFFIEHFAKTNKLFSLCKGKFFIPVDIKNLENIEYQKNKFKKILEKFFGLPNFLPNFVCFWKNWL